MKTKGIIGFILGIAALLLQIPGLLLVFSNTGMWNFAVVILLILMIATVILALLAAIFSILGKKKAAVLFLCSGIAGVLALAVTLYLLLSIEFTVITMALSAILLFIAAKVVSVKKA